MSQASSNPFTITVRAAVQAARPAWMPPAGYFADVPMRNTPNDVVPSIYVADNYLMNNPFALWGGSAVLRDYSELGAQVFYSGGHESAGGLPNYQFSLICDFSSLSWRTANVPLQSNRSDSFVAGYAPDGTPYCPHSYLGLQELPAAWGGAAQGTLVSFFWAGSSYANRINLLDVSRPSRGYTTMATRQAQNADPGMIRFSPTAQGGNYPITVMDEQRKGWWVAVNGPVSYTLFVDKAGAITQYPALGGNLGNGAMVLCPSLQLLIAIDGGYASGTYADLNYRTLYVRNLATGAVTRTSTSGSVPSLTFGYDGSAVPNFHRMDVMGLQWVEELGCIVGLDQSEQPPSVVKLSPPATNPATNPWTWSKVALQHWPSDSKGQATIQTAANGYWSKFRWVPSLQAFVVCGSSNTKPQVIRLT
ncbi:hypothetical protein [Pseudoduganella aquatica]|uniref:Uncharacterized protein n=1 Tax=Pseudoduganella aquatica TaxID=2660641 RepID=A0A7X4HFF7_9BURK|nr:hypothetical protein [Pseudoduganella aquatica]MYN10281.1 hypothetical protein [Pseudoduganella aquatica]